MSDLDAFDFSQPAECSSCHETKGIVVVTESVDKAGQVIGQSQLCEPCNKAAQLPIPEGAQDGAQAEA